MDTSSRAGDTVVDDARTFNQLYATVRYEPSGLIRSANLNYVRLVGRSLETLRGRHFLDFVHPDDRERQKDVWEKMVRGEVAEDIGRWIDAGGGERWLQARFVLLRDADGQDADVMQVVTDVTELQAREADYQGQIAAIEKSQAVIHFALDGTITAANDLFLDAVGYGRDEVVGRPHAMFVDETMRDSEAYRSFWQRLGAGDHLSGEYARLRKDGATVWLQAVYSPIRDRAGRTFKVVKYATDVTEEKLRQADYRWQINAIHKSNAVITFDMYGTILDANDNFLAATGYTLPEIQGAHHRIFVENAHAHSSDYARFWSDLRRGRHRSGLYRRVGRDGREIWFQATYNPIFDMSGEPIKVVKYASVVTEEKLFQADHEGQIAAIDKAQCVISFELDGTILDANDNFLAATGYRFSELRGRHHSMFVDAATADSEAYRDFWRDLAAGRHRNGEYRRLRKDGSDLWLQASYNPIRDLNGRPFKVVKYAADITRRKLESAELQGQIAAIDRSQGVAFFGLDGTILSANAALLGMLGYSAAEVEGRPHSLLVDVDLAASPDYQLFWEELRRGNYQSGLHRRVGKDGREVWLQCSYNPILDLDGKPLKVMKIASDVTSNVALAEAFEDAKRQALHDSATSLPNRAKLSHFLDTHLANPAATLTLLYIDLDRFKPINDTFGHHVGDRVLGEVADRLRRALREDQIVARIGGDEFVIAAPGLTPDRIEALCQALYRLMGEPIHHDGGDIHVGMSVGIAIAPQDGGTPDELLRAADTALYRAKQDGRGQYAFFATEMNEKIIARRQLAEDMRHSLSAGHFYLEYQPRFDSRARRIRSAEALVRWAHPERGRINPMDFISLAEQNGLIVPLGDWILKTACAQACTWPGIGVSVNISPVQFRDGNLVEKVRDCLDETGLSPHLLELEITEGVLLEDADHAVSVLNALKALGIKLAMDDFGTGYSSLSYLRNFPFDVLKIDRSFIMDLDTTKTARPIVQAILALGRSLGIEVTAEGVETNEQLAVLTADKCNEIQGYLMSRPLTAETMAELIEGVPELTSAAPAAA
ncbi:PAS domain S-box protein [Ensifer soli]|uniref:PAS domain S-box protein n=1 Tax=Ciceribacter sp. sgz301302 TaxID=3342379 RepID=UPI0035B7FF7B